MVNAWRDPQSAPSRAARARLIRNLRRRGIRNHGVLAAMARVPRELFVPDDVREEAYEDRPLPIGSGQTISQPFIVAVMIEALAVTPGDRVLEVGAGSGYAAALLSAMGAQVSAVERLPALAAAAEKAIARVGVPPVSVRPGDGRLGWPEAHPFDAVLVSAAGADVPEALLDQLAVGGRLVAPIGAREGGQMLISIHRTGAVAFERHEICPVQFVPLLSGVGSTD